MNDTIWYYVDRAQQRQGPVTASALADAWRAGEATDESLVWREGMAEWQPLAGFHAELGLAATAPEPALLPPPAPEPAAWVPPAASPVATPAVGGAPAKSGSGCLVVGIVLAVLLLVIVGVLAAIALPAYNDYVERAEALRDEAVADETDDDATGWPDDDGMDWPEDDATDEDAGDDPVDAGEVDLEAAVDEGRSHQGQDDAFVANTDRCPRDASELDLPAPTTPGVTAFRVGEALTRMCTIEIVFGGTGAAGLAGETIVLSRDSAGDWYCTSDLSGRVPLPADCH